jgi:hypothetical protein
MYSLEQIYKIWKTGRPLYYRIVEGEKSNGIHRHTDYVELKKGDLLLTSEERLKESETLYERFVNFLDMLNDGYYTVVLQSSKSASSSAAPYTFLKGIAPERVTKSVSGVGSSSNHAFDAMGNSPMMMMIQMMNQQNTQQQNLMQQNFNQQTSMMQTMFQKEMELHKMQQGKSNKEMIFGLLNNPSVLGMLGKFAPQGVGRASQNEAEMQEHAVHREPVAPNEVQNDATARLTAVLRKVKAAYPDQDPIDVLDKGFDIVQVYQQQQQ